MDLIGLLFCRFAAWCFWWAGLLVLFCGFGVLLDLFCLRFCLRLYCVIGDFGVWLFACLNVLF